MAFDDVEGHGLRERAAVLAVAVAAAGMSATPALARHAEAAGLSTGQSAGVTTGSQGSAVPMGVQRGQQLNAEISGGQTQSPSVNAPAVTSTGESGLSPAEIAAIAGGGAMLISAAGFGLTRKHTPPVQPA